MAAASALANASQEEGDACTRSEAPGTAPAAEAPAATATAGASAGSSDSFKDLIANALQSRKMSKSDFNKAVDASVGPGATPFAKKALAEQTLKFLKEKNVTVGGDFVGMGPRFHKTPHLTPGARFTNKYGHRMVVDKYGFAHPDRSGDDSLGDFVGASDAELEQLMSKSLTDDQLDRLMTKAMKDDNRIKLVRALRKRPDLRSVKEIAVSLRVTDAWTCCRRKS